MKQYIIYKLIFPSGKIYIGQSTNLTRRFYQYENRLVKRQPLLYNLLCKYKWKEIIKEILFTGLTKEEADYHEIRLIAQEKSLNRSANLAEGGKSGLVKKIMQYDLDGNFIKEWDTLNEVCNFIGKTSIGSQNYMRQICRDNSKLTKQNRYGGFLWLYKQLHNKGIKPYRGSQNREILQLNLKGEIIKRFSSFKDAAISTGIKEMTIRQGLKRNFAAGGYIWEYKDEYNSNKDYSRKRKGINKRAEYLTKLANKKHGNI